MNPSFHIIKGFYKTKKGDFIGYDSYSNSVFISKYIYLDNNFDIKGNDISFYCLANVKEIKSENSNNIKIKILSAYKITSDCLELIKYVSDLVNLHQSITDENCKYSKLLKIIHSDYDLFKEQTNYSKSQKFNFSRNVNEVNYNLPYLLLSKNCFALKQKLDKYINYYGYDTCFINNEGQLSPVCDVDSVLWNIENRSNNAFKITLIPFYKSLQLIYMKAGRSVDKPFLKIITKDSLKKFNLNEIEYFDQFYKIIDSKCKANEFKLKYHLEHSLDFVERLKKSFDTIYVYAITPIVSDEDFQYDRVSIEKTHHNLINIIEDLEIQGITNLMILPPEIIHSEVLQEVYYYLNPPEEDGYSTYGGWVELGDQEMKRWDEETDGFWRIENDFN
jgi:hypothetical protein